MMKIFEYLLDTILATNFNDVVLGIAYILLINIALYLICAVLVGFDAADQILNHVVFGW